MKNNKHLLFILLVLTLAFCTLAVACGDEGSKSPNSTLQSKSTASNTSTTSATEGSHTSTTTFSSEGGGDDLPATTTEATRITTIPSVVTTRPITEATAKTTARGDDGAPVTTASQKEEPVITTAKPVTTAPKVTTTTKAATTTTTTKKVTTAPKPQGPAVGTVIKLTYTVNDTKAGSLTGSTSQSISYGKTSSSRVTAQASLGYRFVKWSDGVTTPSRDKDMPTAHTSYQAIFELDTRELPILMINTSTGSDVTSKDTYIDGTISVLNTDDEYLLDNLKMQIRGRGNATWKKTFNSDPMHNKRPYRIKLSEQQKLAGVGKGKNKDWVLMADHCDQSLLRNNMVYTFAKSLDYIYWQPSVQSVEVYLNGSYHGVYLLCEQVEVNKNKVNISEDLTSSEVAFLVMYSEYTELSEFATFSMAGKKYEIKSDLSEGQWLAELQKQYIIDYMNQCWSAVEKGDRAEIEQLMDINSIIDSYIVHELFKNLDTGWDNFYMYKNLGGKLCVGPVWDFDQCAGNANEGIDDPTGIRGGQTQPWYAQLLEHNWFRKLLQKRWNELQDQINAIPDLIISTAEGAYNSYCRNFDKWKIFGYKINRETVVREFRTYKEHYQFFADFMTKRIDWLNSYWGSPSFAFDGKLDLTGSGTMRDPYKITNANDFMNLSLCLSGGQTFSGKFFLQTADIDMSGITAYSGLGSSAAFAGCYNGNGHIINAVIKGSDGCVFPYVTGTVINVITTGSTDNTGITGGIARSVRSTGKIVNCASYMDLVSSGNVGGIVASNEAGAVIINCFFGGTIRSNGNHGAINAWQPNRPGTFNNNYYLNSVANSASHTNNGQSESGVDKATTELANMLNSNLSKAQSSAGTGQNSLCTWKLSDGRLVLVSK